MFRFTIRDLLWLTIVVAMGVAWSMANRHCAAEITRFKQYRGVAVALERLITNKGWSVRISDDGQAVFVERHAWGSSFYPTTCQPLESRIRDQIEAKH